MKNKRIDTRPGYLTADYPAPGGKVIDLWVNQLWQDYNGNMRRSGDALNDSESRRLAHYLIIRIKEGMRHIHRNRALETEYGQIVRKSITEEEKNLHVLEFAKKLGADKKQLKGDRRALNRNFALDAVNERCRMAVLGTQYEICLLLNRLSYVVEHSLQMIQSNLEVEQVWQEIGLEPLLSRLIYFQGDNRLRSEAFRCLSRTIIALPQSLRTASLNQKTQSIIYRLALDKAQDTWLQTDALSLLQHLSVKSFLSSIQSRLEDPSAGDDLFVRKRCVELLFENLETMDGVRPLIDTAIKDRSPYVRQTIATSIRKHKCDGVSEWLKTLCLNEADSSVVAASLLAVAEQRAEETEQIATMVYPLILSSSTDSYTLRVAMHCTVLRIEFLLEAHNTEAASELFQLVRPVLEKQIAEADTVSVRRWAAQANQKLQLLLDARGSGLLENFNSVLQRIRPGERRRIPSSWVSDNDAELTGRVLSVLSQDDFNVGLEKSWGRYYLRRGDVFCFRFWRFIYEFMNPSTDKRQAFPYVRGRSFASPLFAPSPLLGELSPTKVPGEPLQIADEGAWRPFLPLLDEILSCNQWFPAKRIQRYSPEGMVELSPPTNAFRRIYASIYLSFHFKKISEKRNWTNAQNSHPESYIKSLRNLGFEIAYKPHVSAAGTDLTDPSVTRFYDSGSVLGASVFLGLSFRWVDFSEYFYSIYGNSLFDLGVFLFVIMGLFFGRHIILSRQVHKSRSKIPMVIGGWGTRGKSGTERLKGALFEALGCGVISKSTGCEAMFMYAYPFGKLKEMFLYRPNDKATIWEHHSMINMTHAANSSVFLWECMGLTPSYVEILQNRWSRDDYSTLTNAYPDHEDLQGPAGCNVAETISGFIPVNSTVFTTEESMLPILQAAAKNKNTALIKKGWLEAGMLTKDVTERFPYSEHPYNIVLVNALARELGVDEDFALKEMADRVVPDIGVLKSYAVAPVQGRKLEFINGMSANERFGALGNWERMRFDKHHALQEAGSILSTVVNNRADRVPRSKVFAKMLVQDLYADRHFLIGNNLNGLKGFIDMEWESLLVEIDLTEQNKPAINKVDNLLARLRCPMSLEDVGNKLKKMLEGLSFEEAIIVAVDSVLEKPDDLKTLLLSSQHTAYVDAIIYHYERYLNDFNKAFKLRSRLLEDAVVTETFIKEFEETCSEIFQDKFVIVDDYTASGEEVISILIKETPPGLLNRIMGMQNIKGTGLDFVYRWQGWEQVQSLCKQVGSNNVVEFTTALEELSIINDTGQLASETLIRTIKEVEGKSIAQNERAQSMLSHLMENTKASQSAAASGNAAAKQVKNHGWFYEIIQFTEAFLDVGDAVKRRKKANQIYKDIVDRRISLERAAAELQTLVKRQKGGWLWSRLNARNRK